MAMKHNLLALSDGKQPKGEMEHDEEVAPRAKPRKRRRAA
jgi:hypothetical protein